MASPRILVVDDSPTIRKLVEIALRGTEWSVAFAASGKEAITSALATPPDAVLLDFVLPDMRGIDVCARLARDPATASVPILVMTAKEGDDVKALFATYSQVVCWLPKPFTAPQLLKRLSALPAVPPKEASSSFSHAQKERAARALFGHLQGAFAQIPGWLVHMGSQSPAIFFARKILTPDVMDRLLASLAPVLGEVTAPRESATTTSMPPPGADAEDGAFNGHARRWPLACILSFFASSGRTGSLTLSWGEGAAIVYFRRGEIILVTTRDPDAYLLGVRLASVPREALVHAKDEQRRSGKPAPVTLAEQGHAASVDLPNVLHRQSRRIVLQALEACTVSFTWRDLGALPAYVEAHGRHVSTAHNTITVGFAQSTSSPESSLEQLALERLRSDTQRPAAPEDAVFRRVRGFSGRVRRFELNAVERHVLALVDDEHDVGELTSRAGVSAQEMGQVLRRLAEVGLVAERGPDDDDAVDRSRPVLILEPDVEGFQRPFESLLRSRPDPVSLVSLVGETDVVAAIRRERPRMVILNASAATDEVVRAVRAAPGLGHISLVALVDPVTTTTAEELTAAGFDAVLVKPIPYADLERLIDS